MFRKLLLVALGATLVFSLTATKPAKANDLVDGLKIARDTLIATVNSYIDTVRASDGLSRLWFKGDRESATAEVLEGTILKSKKLGFDLTANIGAVGNPATTGRNLTGGLGITYKKGDGRVGLTLNTVPHRIDSKGWTVGLGLGFNF